MKWKCTIVLLAFSIVLASFSCGLAEVEWSVKQTLNIGEAPRDVSISVKSKKVFVLTDEGRVLIYSADGKLEDKITVGTHVDAIKVGPQDDTLFLTSRKKKTVEVISLDFIRKINVSGSPSKGPADAPVVIAVFSDFQ